jgi:chromosome segregation ATPase
MPNFGKKILSAFVDIEEEPSDEKHQPAPSPFKAQPSQTVSDASHEKFKLYFEKLFKEANLPGPDYFEFSKMIEAMQSIPDEKTRYISAFAGLSAQGLDKSKLVASAEEYIRLLQADSQNFNSTINNAVSEKVELKKKQLEEKSQRIQQLTREITDLNNEIILLGNEIKENEEKINNNLSGYAVESDKFKSRIEQDIQKINTLL